MKYNNNNFIILISMILSFLLIGSSGSASTIYDNFTAPLIDGQKWINREFVRETVEGQLALKVGNTSNYNYRRVDTGLFNPSAIHTIESDVTVQSSTRCLST